MSSQKNPRVYVETLGCSRNDVDSSELSGSLSAGGWELVDSPEDADVSVVNTCGFIEQAKKDSVDTILGLSDGEAPVVAIGCMAERYGKELAAELPEAAAVLGFDSYSTMSEQLRGIIEGHKPESHVPVDRRTLLPISPTDRPDADTTYISEFERALNGAPWQPVKLASGCDRRCTFCAIPTFRGSFVSRTPTRILSETMWLAGKDIKEVFLVSENTSSYGKDLGDIRLLETLVPELASVKGIERVRISYLQPAEIRPGLLEMIAETEGVASYFDISFQHASSTVLRRMRRFGSLDAFLELVQKVRSLDPEAGIRSNVIVGFPGETDEEFQELLTFLGEAELDVAGVFEYSDEDGTEAATMDGKVAPELIAERAAEARAVAEVAMNDRAERRIGTSVRVIVEEIDEDEVIGRAEFQGPEVDGVTRIVDADPEATSLGDVLDAVVIDSLGVDLDAEMTPAP